MLKMSKGILHLLQIIKTDMVEKVQNLEKDGQGFKSWLSHVLVGFILAKSV